MRWRCLRTAGAACSRITALADRRGRLLAHHGMVAIGATLDDALALAIEAETLAEMYRRALQIGESALLGDAAMETVLHKVATYGQPTKSR